MSIKERLGVDRAVPHDSFRQKHCGVMNSEPISIIDDVKDENEEENYEEMEDDEEDDDDLLDSTSFRPGHQEFDCAGPKSPRCLVCGRTQTPRVRLFKWPNDLQLRKSWLTFFHLSMDYLENCKDPYICSIHFDADQFLYEEDRIFWKQNPFPRFRRRRSMLAEPFPWDLDEITTRKLPIQSSHQMRLNRGPAHGYRVTFREAYFKSKSKSSHPVAVVSLPDNPNIFYEFSYTRTSPIDSSKFYSCLTCRRAKAGTRIKDVIRTIHIKDGIVRSRGDPFYGHHVACRPFTKMSPIQPKATDGYTEYTGPMDFNDDRQSSRITEVYRPPKVHTVCWNKFHLRAPRKQGYPVSGTNLVPVRSSSLCFVRQRRARPLPQCHLCLRVLPSTQLLVQHLQRHMELAPNCRFCGSKMSPDEQVRLRRLKMCSICLEKVFA